MCVYIYKLHKVAQGKLKIILFSFSFIKPNKPINKSIYQSSKEKVYEDKKQKSRFSIISNQK